MAGGGQHAASKPQLQASGAKRRRTENSAAAGNGSSRLRHQASACAVAKLKAARQGYEATLKDIENTLETKEAELVERERLIKVSQSSLAEQERELAAREAALKAKEAELQQDALRHADNMGQQQNVGAELLAEAARASNPQTQGLMPDSCRPFKGGAKCPGQDPREPAHRAHSNPAQSNPAVHPQAADAPTRLQRSHSSPPGVHRTQVQPSDWGLHLLKQLSGDKSGALPQNLMRRRLRGARPATAPVHAEPAAPPATTHPAAALEQTTGPVASVEAAHLEMGSAAEQGAAMDWTAEPLTETAVPPVAPPGSRPSLPKLRVKLGGVRLSGGSSQAATTKPHATANTVPDPEGTPLMGDGDAQHLDAGAAAEDQKASGAEATKTTELAAATPAQSDGSENMLFRLADAATMDVDLDGSIGSPPTVQSRKGKSKPRQGHGQGPEASAALQTPLPQALADASEAASAERRWRLSGAPPPGTKPQPVAEPPKAVLVTSPDARVARPARSFSKHLDYKSCQHILCLTKDMARHLLPPAPQSATHAGGTCQLAVDVEDQAGRVWPMTYRCVPHRYSYELRAGWKPFASFWNVCVGDTVELTRPGADRSRLRVTVHQKERPGRALTAAGGAEGAPTPDSSGMAAACTPLGQHLLAAVQRAAEEEEEGGSHPL